MIPIRDINPTRRKPVMTWALIFVNVAVWVYQLFLGDLEPQFIYRWGVIPHFLLQDPSWQAWVTPVSSMFLHGGLLHLLGNMWFLHVFGDNVEDNLGRGKFLAFYLLSGLAAVALQVAINPMTKVPMVGASGAIAGVLGAYVLLYPRAKVVTLIPIFIFIQFVELPAFIFLFVWFGYQLLMGFSSLGGAEGGVAFFAHVGGFLAGLVMVKLFTWKRGDGPKSGRGRDKDGHRRDRVLTPEWHRPKEPHWR